MIAVPWLDGARAPWWQDNARAGFVGIGSSHDAGDLARAAIESVAFEVDRCLAAVRPGEGHAEGLSLGGAGAAVPLWVEVLTSITGLPATRRRSGEAASAGAALLGSRALGLGLTLDRLDPVEASVTPEPAEIARYAELHAVFDRAAAALIGLERYPDAAP